MKFLILALAIPATAFSSADMCKVQAQHMTIDKINSQKEEVLSVGDLARVSDKAYRVTIKTAAATQSYEFKFDDYCRPLNESQVQPI